jgi:hypothetical protein
MKKIKNQKVYSGNEKFKKRKSAYFSPIGRERGVLQPLLI